MVNLLTVSEKKQILKEYKIRLVIVLLFASAVLIVIATIFLIPPYVMSITKYDNMSSRLEIEKKKISDMSGDEDPIKITKDVNNKLKILNEIKSTLPNPYSITTIIIKNKPTGLLIDAILYDRDKDKEKITINGVAKNRETLLLFLRSMDAESEFTDVKLPISSFVKGENINFSLLATIDIASKKTIQNEKK